MPKLPPSDTVRGHVSHYLNRNRHLLGSPVLEFGSRCERKAWWNDIRGQIGGDLEWVGVDMQPGPRVDRVADVTNLPFADESFRGVVCAEMLEHCADPGLAIREAYRMLHPGCWALFTTPFCFPVHAFPDDYWRLTPSGLSLLLQRAGFVDISVETAGDVRVELDDHGEGLLVRHIPMHVLGKARRESQLCSSL